SFLLVRGIDANCGGDAPFFILQSIARKLTQPKPCDALAEKSDVLVHATGPGAEDEQRAQDIRQHTPGRKKACPARHLVEFAGSAAVPTRRAPLIDPTWPRSLVLYALPARTPARRRKAPHLRDHVPPRRGQDHAHRETAAVRRRDPARRHGEGAQIGAPRHLRLDGGGKAARHFG